MVGDELPGRRMHHCRRANDRRRGMDNDATRVESGLVGGRKLDRRGLQHGRLTGVRQPQLICVVGGAKQASGQHDEPGDGYPRQESSCQLRPGKPCHFANPSVLAAQRPG